MDDHHDPIVVEQSRTNVNVLWGFLVIAFGLALWRGHEGAQTGTSRLVIDVILGLALVASVAAWVASYTRPARLEISRDVVTLSYRGKPNTIELRGPGPLYVHRVFNPKGGAQSYLKVAGSDNAIPLVLFNWKDVESACRAAGWPVTPPRTLGRRRGSPR